MTTLADDSGALETRVDTVRSRLAHGAGRQPDEIAARVAASVTHLGLVARLLAPAIAALALGDARVSLALEDLWWQDHLGGPYPLSITPTPATDTPTLGPAVEVITGAIAQRYRVGEHVLWGNVASAANSAAWLISTPRPDLTRSARAAADAILADVRVEGGRLRAGPDFRRRSCCLIYRIAGDRTAICGDCILGGRDR
jgi:hypothetical protein